MGNSLILKLSVIIIVVGFVVGGWRSWHSRFSASPAGGNIVQLELLTTADKASWVRSQVFSFNELHADKWQVTVNYVDSRAAMQRVLAGVDRPVLWSPESPVWIARANAVWLTHSARPLVQLDDPASFHVFLKSPLVFLTTREKAVWMRPYLGGGDPWGSIYAMNTGRIRPPWGALRYSYADPTQSNSGMAALAMMLNAYVRTHPSADILSTVAASPGFGTYLVTMDKGLRYDASCRAGTAALTTAFAADTGSRDMIVTYENIAVSVASKNKDLVVIYPSPTEVAEQSACIVDGPWTTPDQREAAEAFMTYIAQPQSLRLARKYHMRLADAMSMTTADEDLTAYAPQGFQENYTTEEAPPYDASNIAVEQWVKEGSR